MTDRIKGCYVAFDRDYRMDAVETILKAIRTTKGVTQVSVEGMITSPDDWMARQHVRQQLADTNEENSRFTRLLQDLFRARRRKGS